MSAITTNVESWHGHTRGEVETYLKSVLDGLAKKPVVIWETGTGVSGLTALDANASASPSWQLTGLDMTPYKYIKIYSKAAQKSGMTASASRWRWRRKTAISSPAGRRYGI